MTRNAAFCVALGLAVALRAESAVACDCDVPAPRVWAYPRTGSQAPANTVPRFLLWVPPGKDRVLAAEPYSHASVICQRAGRVEAPSTVRTGYLSALVELAPKGGLPADDTCAVVEASHPDKPLNWFRVDGTVDATPPQWSGVRGGWVGPGPFAPESCVDGSGVGTVWLGPATDDTTGPESLMAEVWVSTNQDEPIDFDSAPTAWLTTAPNRTCDDAMRGVSCENPGYPWDESKGVLLELSGGASCRPGGNFPLPFHGSAARVGIRLVDLAGHRSATSEVRVPGVRNSAQAFAGLEGRGRLLVTLLDPSPATDTPRWSRRHAVVAFVLAVLALAAGAWLFARRRAAS